MKVLPLGSRCTLMGAGDLLFPEDFAREIAFGDTAGLVLGDKDAIAGHHDGIGGESDVVDGPALLAVAIEFVDAVFVGIAYAA